MHNISVPAKLADAQHIYARASTIANIDSANDLVQNVTDGLWEFGKLKKPDTQQIEQREQLKLALEMIVTRNELLGLFDGASAQQRKSFAYSMNFATTELGKQRGVYAAAKLQTETLSPTPA